VVAKTALAASPARHRKRRNDKWFYQCQLAAGEIGKQLETSGQNTLSVWFDVLCVAGPYILTRSKPQ